MMLKFIRFIFNCFIAILCTHTITAQYSNLAFHHLSVKNGLSQGVNNCIYKDSKGYIWISSFDGLNRYDGIGCLVYRNNPTNNTSIKGTLFLNIQGLHYFNRKSNTLGSDYEITQAYIPY